MKKLLLLIGLVALLAAGGLAQESKLEWHWHYPASFISLNDAADSIYIGTLGSSYLGLGGQVSWLFPLTDDLSWGPNANFSYNLATGGSWNNFTFYQPSVGGIVKTNWGGYPFYIFLNYNLGTAVAEQTIANSAIASGTRPAGTVAANIRGLVLGARGQIYSLTDRITIGPYFTYGLLSLLAFEYESLRNLVWTTQWVNIDIRYLEAGCSLTF